MFSINLDTLKGGQRLLLDYIITLDKQFLIQVCWQLFNTVILIAVLSWLLYKPVLNFLEKRKQKIEEQLSSAAEKLGKAEMFKSEYEEKLKNIENERNEILDDARSRAKQREQEIIAEAKQEADNLKKRAMLDIQREQEKAKDEMKNQIIEISSLMTSRFIKASIDRAEQDKFVEEAISGLGEVKWQN